MTNTTKPHKFNWFNNKHESHVITLSVERSGKEYRWRELHTYVLSLRLDIKLTGMKVTYADILITHTFLLNKASTIVVK